MMVRSALTVQEKAEIWREYQAGASLRSISRTLGRTMGTLRILVASTGGRPPLVPRRSALRLAPAEREEISWGSETPIRARTVPVRSADAIPPLPRRPRPRPSPRQRWPTRPRRRRQGPRDPRSPPSASGVAADVGPAQAADDRPGPPRRGEPGHPKGPLGRLPRHPGDPPPVAPRARE